MPDTRPNQFFDEEGVCDACRAQEKKVKIDWETRKKEFEKKIEKYRSKDGSNYDCVIGVSGGKDSTWQLHMIKEVYNLNPLLVSFEPTLPTKVGIKNLENLRNMGVDLIHFKKNPHIYKKLCLKGLTTVGDNEWPNHVGVFTYVPRVAVNYKVPLVVWGENPEYEYGGPKRAKDLNVSNRRRMEEFEMCGLRIHDMVGDGITMRDLIPYIYTPEKELEEIGFMGIYLGYYFEWNLLKQVDYIKKHCGWSTWPDPPREGTFTDYEDLDCDGIVVHEYLKYVKYGFGRATDHACHEIRYGRRTREEMISIVKKYDGRYPKNAMKRVLDYFEITKEEFFDIIKPFINKEIFEREKNGEFIRDSHDNFIRKEECILK